MITTRLKIDISGFKGAEDDIKQALVEGLSHGSEVVREHALADHGLDAHAKQRYVRRSGELNRSIQQIPATISGDDVKAGVIARKDYAAAVEEGHGHAPGYPFMKPAIDDKAVQDEILDVVADALSRALR